jgi:hypothetical protein
MLASVSTSIITNTDKLIILTVAATLAEFFTEVLGHDTGTRLITSLSWMVAGLVVVHRIGRAIFLELNLAAVHGPEPVHFKTDHLQNQPHAQGYTKVKYITLAAASTIDVDSVFLNRVVCQSISY